MLEAARRAAEETLLDRVFFTLSPAGDDQLARLLDAPARPDERLRRLMRTPAPWEPGRPAACGSMRRRRRTGKTSASSIPVFHRSMPGAGSADGRTRRAERREPTSSAPAAARRWPPATPSRREASRRPPPSRAGSAATYRRSFRLRSWLGCRGPALPGARARPRPGPRCRVPGRAGRGADRHPWVARRGHLGAGRSVLRGLRLHAPRRARHDAPGDARRPRSGDVGRGPTRQHGLPLSGAPQERARNRSLSAP